MGKTFRKFRSGGDRTWNEDDEWGDLEERRESRRKSNKNQERRNAKRKKFSDRMSDFDED